MGTRSPDRSVQITAPGCARGAILLFEAVKATRECTKLRDRCDRIHHLKSRTATRYAVSTAPGQSRRHPGAATPRTPASIRDAPNTTPVSVIALLQLRKTCPARHAYCPLHRDIHSQNRRHRHHPVRNRPASRHLGHEVLVFAPDGGIPEFEGARIIGMKGHSFALYPELRLSLPRASMRGQMLEFQPDLLHVADPALLGIAALYYGGGANGGALHLPLVISYHTDLPAYLHYYELGFLEPHIWRIMRTPPQSRHPQPVHVGGDDGTAHAARDRTASRCGRAEWIRRASIPIAAPKRCAPGSPTAILRARSWSMWAASRRRRTSSASSRSLRRLPARLALIGDGPHRKVLENISRGCRSTSRDSCAGKNWRRRMRRATCL